MGIRDLHKMIERCFADARAKVMEEMADKCHLIGTALIEHARDVKEFGNFTGNTITSYAFGLYADGQLKEIVFLKGQKAPLRAKLEKGQVITLNPDYDGRKKQTRRGTVDIEKEYGSRLSIEILNNYKLKNRKGIEVVVTTGTEYSEYLEASSDLDVLTNTYQAATAIANNVMRSSR